MNGTGNPYRTLIVGRLEQDSALAVGGAGEAGLADRSVSRDGLGRLVIPGRSLAGALVAMARKMYDPLPSLISSGVPESRGGDHPLQSVWRVFHAHPLSPTCEDDCYWTLAKPGETPVELRQCVGIRQDTGARAGGRLFDTECVPRGTVWNFLLEIDTHAAGDQADLVEGVAARVLGHWKQGRCWLGGDVARGMGWMTLKQVALRRISLEERRLWPDAKQPLEKALHKLFPNDAEVDRDDFKQMAAKAPPTRSWCFAELEGTVTAGPRKDKYGDGYGVDALAVGSALPRSSDGERWAKPRGRTVPDLETDRPFAMVQGSNDAGCPFLPGSGLRGPLRHAVSREQRGLGNEIRDPNVGDDDAKERELDPVEEVFGTVARSAGLLVRDAHLVPDSSWYAARVQHHAEDEFAAGPYESAKYDHAVLLRGTIAWKIVVEGESRGDVDGKLSLLRGVLHGDQSQARLGHLPLGGGVWRGTGWVAWSPGQVDYAEEVPNLDQAACQVAPDAAPKGEEVKGQDAEAPRAGDRATRDQAGLAGNSPPRPKDVRVRIRRGDTRATMTLRALLAEVKQKPSDVKAWWIEPRPGARTNGSPIGSMGQGDPGGVIDVALDEARVCLAGGVVKAAWMGPSQFRWVAVLHGDESETKAELRWSTVLLRGDLARFGLNDGPGRNSDSVTVGEYVVDERVIAFRWEA
jgi:CRISPR/Cas system CSM-associated protein Csm3 (group 7 of RAMP superfamily)